MKKATTARVLGILGTTLGCSQHSAATPPDDTYVAARQHMVATQLIPEERGIVHPGVLAAMAKVPRHELVPAAVREVAYADTPLPIGHDQTISQPFIVAFMTQVLDPKPNDCVLEVGTGSGYQAAVLAEMVRAVYTIEIVEPLAKRAQGDLARLDYTNIFVRAGDGYQGWPDAAPFDAIIVTCAPEQVPAPLLEQLRDGGRMIIPVGSQGSHQELILLTKRDGALTRTAVLPVRFVPMTGEAGRTRDKANE